MSIGDIVVVPVDILRKADDFIRLGTRGVTATNVNSVRAGVELLLQNNLVISSGSEPVKILAGQADASNLLKKGLTLLSNTPFETLEVNIGARTQDIRKAYKKLALKYHPDKNPRTTPLFQVIHAACEKLSDKEQRLKEETKSVARARQQYTAAPPAGPGPPPQGGGRQAPRAPAPPKYEQPQRSDSFSNNPSNAEEKYNKPQQNFANGPGAYKYPEDAAKEQSRKADSDRRAKEYAAKCANDLQRRREMEAAQMAKYREDVRLEREAMLKKAQDAYSQFKQQSFDSKPKAEAAQQAAASAAAAANASKQAGGGYREPRQSAEHRPLPGQVNGRVPPPSDSSKPNPQSSKPNVFVRVPVPFGFKCMSIGVDAVELEWKTSASHMHSLSVELSWKNRAMGLRVWESSSKLINCGRCRKKNLVPGAVYEFRIRSVEELVGGMLGNRSEWTESILVTLLQPSHPTSDKTDKATAAAASSGEVPPVFSRFGSNKSFSNPVVNDNIGSQAKKPEGQSVPLGQMPSFHFQRFSTHQAPAEEVKSLHGNPTVSNPAMESPGDKTDEAARSQSAGKKKCVQVEVGDLKEGLKKKASSRYMEKGGLSASAKQAWGQWAQYQTGGSGIEGHDDGDGEEVEEEVNNFDEEKDDDESSDEAKSVGDEEEDDAVGSDGGSIYEDDEDSESEDIVDEEDVPVGKGKAAAHHAGAKVHYSNESKAKDKSQSSNKPIHRPKVVKKKAAAAKHNVAKEPVAKKGTTPTDSRKMEKETKASNITNPKKDQRKDSSDDNDDNYSNIFDEDYSSDEGEIEEWFQLKLPKEKDGGTNGRYPVRAEPFSKSKVVGYLVSGVAVVATADCGDWLKVKIHTMDKEVDTSSNLAKKQQRQEGSSSPTVWGWCLRRYKEQEFLLSANGIVIDNVVEAMNFNAHYNVANKDAKKKKDSENSQAPSPPNDLPADPLHMQSSKASRFSPPPFDGKENNSNQPQLSQPGAKKGTAEVSPPLSSVSTGTSEGGHDEKATFMRSNSIRLPPINSPTGPMDSLDSKKLKSSKSKSKKNKSDTGSSKDKNFPSSEPSSTAARKVEKDSDSAAVRPVSVWSELKDPSGHIYYYNAVTKESKWEPPEWIQEWDVSSGAYYYIHYSDEAGHKFSPQSLHSTWTKPAKYSKLKKYT